MHLRSSLNANPLTCTSYPHARCRAPRWKRAHYAIIGAWFKRKCQRGVCAIYAPNTAPVLAS